MRVRGWFEIGRFSRSDSGFKPRDWWDFVLRDLRDWWNSAALTLGQTQGLVGFQTLGPEVKSGSGYFFFLGPGFESRQEQDWFFLFVYFCFLGPFHPHQNIIPESLKGTMPIINTSSVPNQVCIDFEPLGMKL